MFKTLFSKILVITIAFTLLIITQLGLSAAYIVRSHYISDIKQELTRESNYINGIVCTEYLDTRNYSSAKEKLLTASRQYGAALQLIFRDDPVMNADIIDQQCAEVWRIVPLADVGAFAQNIMKSNDIYGYYFDIFSGISENRSLTVSRLIQSGDGLVIGVMLIHYDMTGIYATLKTLYFDIFAAVLIALLIAGTIAFIIAGRITRPIVKINAAVTEFAGGNYDARSSIKSRDEVGKLSESFNSMADVIADTERMRRDFVANVSHELRSPLAGIHGFLEAMHDGVIPEEEYPKYLSLLLDESDHMTKIVNDLLDISSIESGNALMDMTDFDLTELIGSTLLSFERRITDKHADVDVDFPDEGVLVHGDTGRIAEVIRNLIDNAVRFLPDEGGKLGLKIELTDQGRKAASTVSNNGTPIAKEDLPHIFERFYKGEKARTRTKQSGTGLGLSIASLIIREHGGEIWAESDENSTCFSFTLNTAQINRNKH